MINGIIAFCGAKFSGKSTSATIFNQLIKTASEELAFAGHLKTSCAKVFGLDMQLFLDPALKEKELNSYITLTRTSIQEIMKEFYIDKYDYDKHVRPHIGHISETPRQLLQYIGTEVLHPLDPLIHVNVTLRLKQKDKLSLVTDLRFPQEFEALKDRPDFVGVYVKNDEAEKKAETDGHASEKGYLKFKHLCYCIENNGTIDELTQKLKQLIKDKY